MTAPMVVEISMERAALDRLCRNAASHSRSSLLSDGSSSSSASLWVRGDGNGGVLPTPGDGGVGRDGCDGDADNNNCEDESDGDGGDAGSDNDEDKSDGNGGGGEDEAGDAGAADDFGTSGDRGGTTKTAPQRHLTRFPSSPSAAFKRFPQAGHRTSIGIFVPFQGSRFMLQA